MLFIFFVNPLVCGFPVSMTGVCSSSLRPGAGYGTKLDSNLCSGKIRVLNNSAQFLLMFPVYGLKKLLLLLSVYQVFLSVPGALLRLTILMTRMGLITQ